MRLWTRFYSISLFLSNIWLAIKTFGNLNMIMYLDGLIQFTYIFISTRLFQNIHIFSWELERRYQYSKMFHWEPEGHYCTKCGDSTILVLNGTSLNSDSALLALNWQYISWQKCTCILFYMLWMQDSKGLLFFSLNSTACASYKMYPDKPFHCMDMVYLSSVLSHGYRFSDEVKLLVSLVDFIFLHPPCNDNRNYMYFYFFCVCRCWSWNMNEMWNEISIKKLPSYKLNAFT